jgi:hypothetical protein
MVDDHHTLHNAQLLPVPSTSDGADDAIRKVTVIYWFRQYCRFGLLCPVNAGVENGFRFPCRFVSSWRAWY